jgi:NAD(P)-dependent dehydrogenase (short-subunit alcohol dehydrogenase family)
VALEKDSLIDKRIAIIGGTGGIGRSLALAFASKGAHVIVVGRSFLDNNNPRISFVQADLSSLKTAKKVAQELPVETLNLLIMTHGIFTGRKRLANEENIELDMAISYLSRFVIVRNIANRIGIKLADKKSKPRIFIMGFPGGPRDAILDDLNSEKSYHFLNAHYNTVVGNEALVIESAERYPQVNFYGLNPGLIKSNILTVLLGNGFLKRLNQIIIGILFQSSEQYADRIIPLLVSSDIEESSGFMFGRHGDPIYSNPRLMDKTYLTKLIEESEKLVNKGLD